jgi:hypothetical protein
MLARKAGSGDRFECGGEMAIEGQPIEGQQEGRRTPSPDYSRSRPPLMNRGNVILSGWS